jgi:hypothetical protein
MLMNLFPNCLFKRVGESGPVERLLWVSANGAVCYCIATDGKRAWPVPADYGALKAAVSAGKVVVLDNDELAASLRLENMLTEHQKELMASSYAAIKDLVEDPARSIFDRQQSGKLIRQAAQKANVSLTTIYKQLRRYWQRGQTSWALQPDLHRCGGAGKPHAAGTVKLGRPTLDGKQLGVNATEEIQKVFRDGIEKYYHNQKRYPFTKVFDLIIEENFVSGYKVENGVPCPILKPASERPTFAQFRYFYEKHYRKAASLRARLNPHNFEQNHRETVGDLTRIASGPGDVYQIDWTTADVYLVHSIQRDLVIGRPIVYLVVDTFSRLVVGFDVSFFNADYNAAAMAVWNAYGDKAEFCQGLGIHDFVPAHWPARGLPYSILADRGELLGKMSDQLTQRLGIQMANAPAYSPTAKAIVERHFRMRNDEVIRWLPGAVPDEENKIGKRNYRKQAALTKEEFMAALVHAILSHNICQLSDYKPTTAMIRDKVELRPYKIWEWGMKNCANIHEMDAGLVKLNLLPTKAGTVTREGISFGGLHYTCSQAKLEEWFLNARASGSWKVECSYFPSLVDHVLLLGKTASDVTVCDLTPADAGFAGWTWRELDKYRELQRANARAGEQDDMQVRVTSQAQIQHIVKTATQRAKSRGGAKIKNLLEDRATQQVADGQKEAKSVLQAVGATPVQPVLIVPATNGDRAAERWMNNWKRKQHED